MTRPTATGSGSAPARLRATWAAQSAASRHRARDGSRTRSTCQSRETRAGVRRSATTARRSPARTGGRRSLPGGRRAQPRRGPARCVRPGGRGAGLADPRSRGGPRGAERLASRRKRSDADRRACREPAVGRCLVARRSFFRGAIGGSLAAPLAQIDRRVARGLRARRRRRDRWGRWGGETQGCRAMSDATNLQTARLMRCLV